MNIREYDLSEHQALRIGILSDTHGVLHPGIQDVISDCDIALHAGDIMSNAPLAALTPRLGTIIAVRGNNDFPHTWPNNEHPILASIPASARIRLSGGSIALEHSDRVYSDNFSLIHERLRACYPDDKLIVYGHTHVRHLCQKTEPWLANPGAAGETRVHDGASCLVLETNADSWTIDSHVFP